MFGSKSAPLSSKQVERAGRHFEPSETLATVISSGGRTFADLLTQATFRSSQQPLYEPSRSQLDAYRTTARHGCKRCHHRRWHKGTG
jgi:hypothetical protein